MKRCFLALILVFAVQTGVGHESPADPKVEQFTKSDDGDNALVSFPGLTDRETIVVETAVLPLAIQYSPVVDPASLMVKLNGNEISSRFKPENRQEVVNLELGSGVNEIEFFAKTLESEDGLRIKRLHVIRRDEPTHHYKGRVVRGEVDRTETKDSMEQLFQHLRKNRFEQ